MHAASAASINRTAFQATVHCLTGCAIGEVLGMAIAMALGWAHWTMRSARRNADDMPAARRWRARGMPTQAHWTLAHPVRDRETRGIVT